MQRRQPTHVPTIALLQNVNVRTICFASSLIETTRRMELLILSWFVLQATDSLFQLGLILVFTYVSWVVVGPFAGFIADRFSRQRTLVVAEGLNTLTTAAILSLIASHQLQPWHVYVAASLQGSVTCLEQPSRRTGLFDLVGQGRVVNAMSLDIIGGTIGRLAGPILGGVLLSLVGFTGAYSFALVVHLMALTLLSRVSIPHHRMYASGEAPFTSVVLAAKHVVHNPTLMGVLYISFLVNAMIGPVQQFIPAIGRDHLGVGPALVGLLASAEGFGVLVAAGVMASISGNRNHGRVYIVGSLSALLMALLFVWSPWYALSFAALTAGGIGMAGFGTMQNSITMLASPPEMRGRMMGLRSIFIGVGTQVGTLEVGAVAAVLGTQWAISGNLLAGLLLMLPTLLLTPLARRQPTPPQPPP